MEWRRLLMAGWWLTSLLFSVAALGHSAPQSPVEVVRSRNEAVERIVRSSGEEVSPETREKLKDIINGFIDFQELSRRALGKHWDQRTAKEQGEFVTVFRQLVRNSSVKKLEVYKADRVEYLEPVITGSDAKVTTIAHKGEKSVEIVYQMHQVGNDWKAYDVVIDGASTARNYRDSFYKEIAKSSYRDMYEKLVRKLAQEP